MKEDEEEGKNRNFRRNLIFPITRTRHIPVITCIIVHSAEDLSYTTTKPLRQYIFIHMSVPTLKEKKGGGKSKGECHMGLG